MGRVGNWNHKDSSKNLILSWISDLWMVSDFASEYENGSCQESLGLKFNVSLNCLIVKIIIMSLKVALEWWFLYHCVNASSCYSDTIVTFIIMYWLILFFTFSLYRYGNIKITYVFYRPHIVSQTQSEAFTDLWSVDCRATPKTLLQDRVWIKDT